MRQGSLPVIRLAVVLAAMIAAGIVFFHPSALPFLASAPARAVSAAPAPAAAQAPATVALPPDLAAARAAVRPSAGETAAPSVVAQQLAPDGKAAPPLDPAPTGALTPDEKVDRSGVAARPELIAPPPGTDSKLAPGDPQRLRILLDHGVVGLSANADIERVKGMRLVQIAAALGYEPARTMIAQEFPRSPVVRAIVPPADAIRDALDPFTGDAAAADPAPFAALAAYFGERRALATLGAYLVDAVRDDRRLQAAERLDAMFDVLARVPGACLAMARIIAVPHQNGTECPAEFRQRVLAVVRAAGPTGRDADARRIALAAMDRLDGAPATSQSANSGPARRAPKATRRPPR
jgi:hypothetical protein